MKRKLFITIVLICCHNLFSQELKLSCKVIDELGSPLEGAKITNTTTRVAVLTDMNGMFTATYTNDDEKLSISFIGMVSTVVPVKILLEKKSITLIKDLNQELRESIMTTVAPSNYWVGAKVGYNFVSDSDTDNFIGSAIVSLNMLETNSNRNSFSVVGNIGDFKFTKDTA